MITICWTIIHHAAAPVAQGARRLAHAARHFIHPASRGAARALSHAPRVAARPRTWVELVCRTIPAVVGGGGLLIPQPANPPRPFEPPPAIVALPPTIIEPGLPYAPGSPMGWIVPPYTVAQTYPGQPSGAGGGSGPSGSGPGGGSTPIPPATPEPSSAGLLLSGAVGLLLIRRFMRRMARTAEGG